MSWCRGSGGGGGAYYYIECIAAIKLCMLLSNSGLAVDQQRVPERHGLLVLFLLLEVISDGNTRSELDQRL